MALFGPAWQPENPCTLRCIPQQPRRTRVCRCRRHQRCCRRHAHHNHHHCAANRRHTTGAAACVRRRRHPCGRLLCSTLPVTGRQWPSGPCVTTHVNHQFVLVPCNRGPATGARRAHSKIERVPHTQARVRLTHLILAECSLAPLLRSPSPTPLPFSRTRSTRQDTVGESGPVPPKGVDRFHSRIFQRQYNATPLNLCVAYLQPQDDPPS